MRVYIEGAKYQYGKMILVGWAAGAKMDAYAAVQVVSAGNVVPIEVEQRYRPDIRELFFHGEGEGLYGFRVIFVTEDVPCRVTVTIGGEEKGFSFTPGYVAEHKALPPDGMKARLKQFLSRKTLPDSKVMQGKIEPLTHKPCSVL